MSDIIKKINTYMRGLNLRIATRTAIQAGVCFALAVHLYFLLWLNLPAASQALIYFNIALRVSLALIILYIVLDAFRSRYAPVTAARWLDRHHNFSDDLYQNLLELKQQSESEAVLDALAMQANARFESLKYRLPPVLKTSLLFVLLFSLAGLMSVWGLSWDDFRLSLNQFYTNKAQSVAYKASIEISPGNHTIGKNQALTIKILNPERRLPHRLFYRWDTQWRELGMTDFSYYFSSVEHSFEYYVENEIAKSAIFKITCLDEPYVRSWEVHYKYPPHTRLPASHDSLNYGNIEAYKYTQAILSIRTNIPVEKAVMRFSDGRDIIMQAIDAHSFSTQLQVLEPKSWYLELTDKLGRKSQPDEKYITIIQDAPPQVKILYPGEDVALNQTLVLPLIISADDDFGLRNLELKYQVNDHAMQTIAIQTVIPNRLFNRDYLFDMKELGLLPGDRVLYWAEVYDNSPDQQKAVSAKYIARYPTIEEIYREIERQESKKTGELQSALEQTKDLQKDFEQKRRELLKQDKLNWEDKKQLENILQNQENLSRQVEEIAQDFQQLIDKMQVNQAISPETMEKMMKIQELMQEISNEELEKAMKKFGDALQKIDPENLRKAMDNFKFSVEDFAKRIEQTLQLLESIKKEQAVDKALQISKEMEKMQEALHDRSGDLKQDKDKLAADQQSIMDKYQNLMEELKKIDAMLDPVKDKETKQMLSELVKDMQQGEAKKNMQQSKAKLGENNRSSAMSAQQEAMKKMRQFTTKLDQMKSSMGGGSQQEVVQALQNAIRELLIFSKKHEELAARYGNDPYQIMPDLIAHYDGIQLSLNKLFAIPQVTMFIPPKFYIDLTDTNRAYRELFTGVGEMQYMRIPEYLTSIQKGINLMVYDLMQSMKSPSSGSGGGGGMQSLMQMLDSMSQEQMAMSMLTEQLMMQMQQQGGGMDPAMQQQIQKLANDQQRLADNLKRALQNDPEAQKQGNAIKQIIEEAEAVARQLRSNQLSRDIMQRQENIVSRLLDAQRSINKRDTSQRRKGERAIDQYQGTKPETMDINALRRAAMLDDAYRNFPPAYQQVIIRYFKYLNDKME
ncbi:MAG: hypothetical protein Q8J62_08895 [Candidatus Cloacimonadaceae bacterium]|nr:hypothetical protein [Candidatus Cloacimonadaceae bacterium]